MFTISMEELMSVFRDFYNITRFMIVLFDSERRIFVRVIIQFMLAMMTTHT